MNRYSWKYDFFIQFIDKFDLYTIELEYEIWRFQILKWRTTARMKNAIKSFVPFIHDVQALLREFTIVTRSFTLAGNVKGFEKH